MINVPFPPSDNVVQHLERLKPDVGAATKFGLEMGKDWVEREA